jgi:hypothetical protein
MHPTECEYDCFAARLIGDCLVRRISVALHDATITIEQLQRMNGGA